MKDNSGRLGTEKIWKLVLQLAIPAMLAQFVNVAYSIVDRIYIGNIPEIGGNALAGVGVCGPIVTLISSFAYLVGLGGAPLMGISKPVIKAHGSSNGKAFKNAIRQARDFAQQDVIGEITNSLAKLKEQNIQAKAE